MCSLFSVSGESSRSEHGDAASGMSAVPRQAGNRHSKNCSRDSGGSSASNHGKHDCRGRILVISMPNEILTLPHATVLASSIWAFLGQLVVLRNQPLNASFFSAFVLLLG